jgi:protoporphyrinogen/coproporphyrinogen III oxidase
MVVAVVGGGITGLTTAHTLLHEHPGTEVVVLEASDRLGGKIRTSSFAGRPVDWGADAFLARVPEGIELCRELGLDSELVIPAAQGAFVFVDGALRRFPDGLVLGVPTDLDALARSGIVSPAGVERARADLTMGADPLEHDESVGTLVRRRVGDEVFERLVAPLLSGVNAGDADQLSVEAGAPQFVAALRNASGLIEGLRRQRDATAEPGGPVFYGLESGTQTLIEGLADSIDRQGGLVRCPVEVTDVERSSAGYRISLAGGSGGGLEVDAVALATPDPVTARILRRLAPDVAEGISAVDYASVIMVAFAFPRTAAPGPLDGTGFLVAETEGLLMTACSWASSKWAHLGGDDQVILRVSAGRHHDRRALDLDDAALIDALTRDLGTTMGITGAPTEVRITRWARSLPQFRPGHLDRVRAWRATLAAEVPGLVVGGAGFDGLGLPACIRQGRAMAEALRAWTMRDERRT